MDLFAFADAGVIRQIAIERISAHVPQFDADESFRLRAITWTERPAVVLIDPVLRFRNTGQPRLVRRRTSPPASVARAAAATLQLLDCKCLKIKDRLEDYWTKKTLSRDY